jgi:hypothetical protein
VITPAFNSAGIVVQSGLCLDWDDGHLTCDEGTLVLEWCYDSSSRDGNGSARSSLAHGVDELEN